MHRNSINMIIFDDQQSRTPQESIMTRQNSYTNYSQPQIIINEITSLNEKIKQLQYQANTITQRISSSKRSDNIQSNSNNPQITLFYDQLLLAIDKKIQIIIKSIQSIVNQTILKFNEKVKIYEQHSININQTKQYIFTIKEKYQQEIKTLKIKNQILQKQLMLRLQNLEDMYGTKVIQFQRKEKDYIDKIQVLEVQLRQLKNKKSEVTHEKTPPKYNHQEILQNITKNDDNAIAIPNQVNENSKVRKYRIFDIKNQNQSQSQSNNLYPLCIRPSTTNPYRQNQKITEFMIGSAQQFYRDAPKPISTWQKKQNISIYGDYKSEQDIFFYPDWITKQGKFASPLDLN